MRRRNYKPTPIERRAVKMSMRVRLNMRRHNPDLAMKIYLEGFKAGVQTMLENWDFARFIARRDRLMARVSKLIK